ncbi:MAG: carboxypeptidase regulatory-like domain-containing protein [Bryobacteraceae bacterium]|jgi:plastocyanin
MQTRGAITPKSRNSILLLTLACLVAQGGNITGTVSGGKGISVVYLEATPGKTFPPPAKSFDMDQRSLLFQPHILVVPLGATVEFLNSDNLAHNIFWPSVSGNKKLGHNLGTWPTGQKRAFKFDTPGIVPLLCNVHPEMAGYIVVAPTPFYAETDASGSYKIANVPDGTYTISAWHEGLKIESKPIKVIAETTMDFALSK